MDWFYRTKFHYLTGQKQRERTDCVVGKTPFLRLMVFLTRIVQICTDDWGIWKINSFLTQRFIEEAYNFEEGKEFDYVADGVNG
ncbi:hypothetical protein B0A69_09095 [Chryseobacterium shigense]|nr:hypothetical protein B0A69_09095 [Chryseobacterium shigense]